MKTELFDKIADIVSKTCNVSVEEIRSQSRKAEITEARAIFIWQCNQCKLCVNDIARYVGRKRSKTVYDYLANYRLYRESSISFRIFAREVDTKLSETLPKQ